MSNMYISKKTKWVRTDAWRGYVQPINAVGCCNCTGDWSDSPCPTSVVKKEITGFKKLLKKEGIRHKTFVTQSSNVFMVKVNILVHPNDRERALAIADEYQENTRLFYKVD
jgi:hypothetical protein